MHDEKYFKDPDEFKPERFLDENGGFITQKNAAFIPFGIGKRICLGEKLALNNLFMVLIRLIQATKGHQITLPDGPGSADLSFDRTAIVLVPKPFKILLQKICD